MNNSKILEEEGGEMRVRDLGERWEGIPFFFLLILEKNNTNINWFVFKMNTYLEEREEIELCFVPIVFEI